MAAGRLATRAEVHKLHDLLGQPEEALAFLNKAPAEDVARLREAMTGRLFDQHSTLYSRAAAAARIVPLKLLVRIITEVIGPELSGRIAGYMATKAAIRLARKLPTAFLTQITLHLDPRRTRDIIAAMPAELVRPVAEQLLAAREFVVGGRMVGYLSDDNLKLVLEVIDNDADLLRVGIFVELRERLDHALGLLDDRRLAGVVQAANTEGLWPEALTLIDFVGLKNRVRLGSLIAAQDEAVLDTLVDATEELGVWPTVLETVNALSSKDRQRLANLPIVNTPDMLDNIIRASQKNDSWSQVFPLVRDMSDDNRRQVAARIADKPEVVLETLLKAADEHQAQDVAAQLIEDMPGSRQASMLTVLKRQAAPFLDKLEKRGKDRGFWQTLRR